MFLQGVADSHYRFVVIDVGGCGKQNDGSTFQASDLFRLMQTNELDIPNPTRLPGTNVKAPYVFVQCVSVLLEFCFQNGGYYRPSFKQISMLLKK